MLNYIRKTWNDPHNRGLVYFMLTFIVATNLHHVKSVWLELPLFFAVGAGFSLVFQCGRASYLHDVRKEYEAKE